LSRTSTTRSSRKLPELRGLGRRGLFQGDDLFVECLQDRVAGRPRRQLLKAGSPLLQNENLSALLGGSPQLSPLYPFIRRTLLAWES
jgi:hypothetical protein